MEQFANLYGSLAQLRREKHDDDFVDKVGHTTGKLATPLDRVAFWISILEVAHRELHGFGSKLIIVIDNIDPFPGHLQQYLLDTLLPIASSFTIPIIVPVRITTFASDIALYPFHWFSHSGATPINVLMRRLVGFLLDPTAEPLFQSLSSHYKNLAYLRLMDLWLRLLVPETGFRQLFSSIAGTNIRNAMHLATEWAGSPHLPTDYPARGNYTQYVDHVLSLQGIHLVQETLTLIAQSILIKSLDTSLLSQHFEAGEDVVAEKYGDLFGRQFTVGWRTLYKRLEHDLPTSLPPTLDVVGYARALSPPLSLCPISRAVVIARIRGKLNARSDRFLRDVCRHTGRYIEGHLAQELEAVGVSGPDAVSLREFTSERLRFGESYDIDSEISRRGVRHFELTQFRIDLPRPVRDTLEASSPFLAAQALFSPSGARRYVANLFSSDWRNLRPIGLRIIHLLAETEVHELFVKEVYLELRRHFGDNDDVILEAINHLITRTRRLIWIDRRDHFDSVDELLTGGMTSKITLNAAGLGYLNTALGDPAYIQTCLFDVVDVMASFGREYGSDQFDVDNIEDRLRMSLVALKEIVSEEKARLEMQFRTCADHYRMRCCELDCRSAAMDVFGRTMFNFVVACQAHHHQLEKREERDAAQGMAALIREWFSFFRGEIIEHGNLFGDVFPNWVYDYRYSTVKLIERMPTLRDPLMEMLDDLVETTGVGT